MFALPFLEAEDVTPCMTTDPDLFFPYTYSKSEYLEQVGQAKAVCMACPFRVACLDYAIQWDLDHSHWGAGGSSYGVWGGTTYQERRPLVKAAQARKETAA